MTRHNLTYFPVKFAAFFLILFISGVSTEITGQSVESGSVKLTKCAEFQIEGPVADALVADEDRIYVGTADGRVQALELKISSSVWRTELGGEIVSNMVTSEIGTVVVSNPVKTAESVPSESVLRSLSKETGVPNWTVRLPFSEYFFLGKVNGSIAVVGVEGWIAAFDSQSGRVLWRTPVPARITTRPAFSSYGIAFGTREKQIFIVSPETGEIVFKGATEFIPTAITIPSDEVLVVGDERGNVASVGIPAGKNIWKFKSGAGISFVSVSKEGLIVTSLDNFIYSIWMYNGDVIWKRRLPGRVTEGVMIADGLVMALIYGENSAFLIDSKKGKIVDQLPQSDKNFVNQVSVPAKESKLLVTTPDAVIMYALKGCEQKIGKAAPRTPPLTKQ